MFLEDLHALHLHIFLHVLCWNGEETSYMGYMLGDIEARRGVAASQYLSYPNS